MTKLYDDTSPESIEKYAQLLENKSVNDFISKEELTSYGGNKGQIGQFVEKYYFGYDLNSKKEADFPKAGVEVKVTPLKRSSKSKNSNLLRKQKGLTAKERMVLGMINFNTIIDEEWDSNSLINKIRLLLLIFYIHENDIHKFDYKFNLIRLWKPSKHDLNFIKDDWTKIRNKIRDGKAHEISEGDTYYLGACTKGANAIKSMVSQPNSSIDAKSRAFSFKRSYVDAIFEELLNKQVKIKPLLDENQTNLLEKLDSIFSKYYNKTAYDIEKELRLNFTSKIPLSYYSLLTKKIIGVESIEEIEEFQKANITLKTIRLKESGMPKESISFPTFKFKELVTEDWEESEFRETLEETIFFFVIFKINMEISDFEKLSGKEKRKHVILKGIKLWNMPQQDIEKAKDVWETTKNLAKYNKIEFVRKGNKTLNNLPGQKYYEVAHVRPHGKDSKDVDILPDGRTITKQCFWLNAKYIKEQLEK